MQPNDDKPFRGGLFALGEALEEQPAENSGQREPSSGDSEKLTPRQQIAALLMSAPAPEPKPEPSLWERYQALPHSKVMELAESASVGPAVPALWHDGRATVH